MHVYVCVYIFNYIHTHMHIHVVCSTLSPLKGEASIGKTHISMTWVVDRMPSLSIFS
jgi:hypothetical protein